MQVHYRCSEYHGRVDIIGGAEGQNLMAFSLLKLKAGEFYEGYSGAYEIAAVILSGVTDITVEGQEFRDLGRRANVFSGRATTVYIPRESSFRVVAPEGFLEIALCQVQAEKKYNPFVVRPEEVVVTQRGADLWKREIHDIIVDNGQGRVDKIIVGETFSVPGNWSSFPPHKHDRHAPPEESELIEIYHFRIEPVKRFGVQIIYTEDGSTDEAFVIRDRDTILISSGYHPVAAPPGVNVYYLWFLAGEHGRKMIPYDDPAFQELLGK